MIITEEFYKTIFMEYLFLITGIGIGWFLDKQKTKKSVEEVQKKANIIVKKIQRGKSIETISFKNGK